MITNQKKTGLWDRILEGFSAIAFAEAGEFEMAREWLSREKRDIEIKTRYLEGILENSIETAAATAFAEAGEHYQAIQIIGRLRGKRLLVVCEGDEIPDRLMKQGIELAEKMDLEVIVLNIFTHTADSRPSVQRTIWRDEFQTRAKKALENWMTKANPPKINLTQIIEFGEPVKILQETLLKIQGIRYILSLKDLIVPQKSSAKVSVPHSIS